MSNKKLKYVKQSMIENILKDNDWLLLLGERSNGKSYAAKNLIIKKCIDDEDIEMIYLRRYDLDIKDSLCVGYFGDCPVESMTDGKYSCIDVYRKGIYLSNIDENGKIKHGRRIGYCHSLSGSEHYKSLAFPKVKYIIYEETISQDGRYLFNETNKLQQYVSTIFRNNNKGKIIMIGNRISRICPYYREWNLKVHSQKLGTVDKYIFHNDNGDDTRLAVYMTDSLNFNSGLFFGNAANNITKGAYEVQEYPHLFKSIVKYKILYTFVLEYNEFKFLCQLLQDKEKCNDVFWFVQPKTTEIQENTRVISNQFSSDPLYTGSLRDALNDNERRVLDLFKRGKVCFSDNLTGTEFNTIITYMR